MRSVKKITAFFEIFILLFVFSLFGSPVFAADGLRESNPKTRHRIVSLDGTSTEILFALGVGDQIVGRDRSSYYPKAVNKIPHVGYHNHLNVEGILALKPTLVVGPDELRQPGLTEQIESAGVKRVGIPNQPDLDGAYKRIRVIARSVDRDKAGEKIIREIKKDLKVLNEKLSKLDRKTSPRVLCLYLWGPKTSFLMGTESRPVGMLGMLRAENAVPEIKKPRAMSTEAVAAAKPDAILVYSRGLDSVGGIDGLMKLPGIAQTPAGKNKKVIALDDIFLGSFGARTGKAALDLLHGLYEVEGPYFSTEGETEYGPDISQKS